MECSRGRNGPNIKDRTRNSYNDGEVNHTDNNYNKIVIDKEGKVETQENELERKTQCEYSDVTYRAMQISM